VFYPEDHAEMVENCIAYHREHGTCVMCGEAGHPYCEACAADHEDADRLSDDE